MWYIRTQAHAWGSGVTMGSAWTAGTGPTRRCAGNGMYVVAQASETTWRLVRPDYALSAVTSRRAKFAAVFSTRAESWL